MSWELGAPTDKSGPAYRRSRKRQFLKYAGVAALGFGGGTLFSHQESTDGIVSAFGTENATADEPTNASTNGSISTGGQSTGSGTESTVEEVAAVEPVRTNRNHVLASVVVSNSLETVDRRGLYVTIRHEPYESKEDRVVELPPQSSQEYLLRVPRAGQIRLAMLTAVENDDYEIDVRLGGLPERYGDE
jgi:hypothetical protein